MPKSPIWQHFTSIDGEKKVKCLYCSQQLSVANKSTCTLIRHLSKKHPTLKIRRHSSTDFQSQEELLANNDDADDNSDSPGATILEYQIEDSDIEEISENNHLSSRIVSNNQRHDDTFIEDPVLNAVSEANRHLERAQVSLKTYANKRTIRVEDEFDNFGQLIASKIRKIQDVEKREVVMHSVYNVVYEALMKNI